MVIIIHLTNIRFNIGLATTSLSNKLHKWHNFSFKLEFQSITDKSIFQSLKLVFFFKKKLAQS